MIHNKSLYVIIIIIVYLLLNFKDIIYH